MNIVVQKYGGSSVADANHIKKVARRIARTRAEGKQVCVVVSAMGSTTDDLIARAHAISAKPPRRELDMLLSSGERAAMSLLSMAVFEEGYEAISFTGSQCGIMTNDRHWGARIVEVRPFRVEDELRRERVVIVAGFQGVSYKREITTLGRGGSDITAVALAAALGAEYCELCSDVDGVFTADPRVVPAAELVTSVDHDTALELAAHGARVLHPEAVEFAKQKGVALYARPTAGGSTGTRIDRTAVSDVVGVATLRDLLRLSGPARSLLDLAADAPLPILAYSQRGELGELWVSTDDVPHHADLETRLPGTISLERGWGAVTAAGDLVGRDAARVQQLALVAAGEHRHLDATPLRVTVFCRTDDVEDLTQEMHSIVAGSS